MTRHNKDANSLNIYQLNARRAKNVSDEIFSNVKQHVVDVLLLQEPYCYKNKITRLGITTTIYTGYNPDETPWAAVVIFNKSLNSMLSTQYSNSHCVCVEVSFKEEKIYVISIYCQSSHKIAPYLAHLRFILTALRNKKVFISMDSNAKSPLWYSKTRDISGSELESFILENRLYLLNEDGFPATFSSEVGSSNVDVTLTTCNLVKSVKSWEVIEESTTSDHNAIKIIIAEENDSLTKNYYCKGYNVKKADWESFQINLAQYKSSLGTHNLQIKYEVTEAARNIKRAIKTVCKGAIPRKIQVTQGSKWWTPDLSKTKKLVYKHRKLFQKEKNQELKAQLKYEYHKLRSEYHIAIKKIKENSWREFTTVKDNGEPCGILYKLQCKKIQMNQFQYSIRIVC